jgi:hypothetical protein
MARYPVPPITGVYIHIGNGDHWHTANSATAGRTTCGITLAGRPYSIEEPNPYMYVDDVCRRCAGFHLALARALDLVSD